MRAHVSTFRTRDGDGFNVDTTTLPTATVVIGALPVSLAAGVARAAIECTSPPPPP